MYAYQNLWLNLKMVITIDKIPPENRYYRRLYQVCLHR
jgi:hypothetical protein